MRSCILGTLLFVCLASPAARADVLRVSPSASTPYDDIQAAIDAASDGDLVVVGAGDYPGFRIAGKGVSVVGIEAGLVTILGRVEVAGLPVSSEVLLASLSLRPPYQSLPGIHHPALLEIHDCGGSVRVQDCSIEMQGSAPLCSNVKGAHAARVSRSERVSFVGCSMVAVAGAAGTEDLCNGSDGGHGLLVRQGSRVAVYTTNARGGRGSSGSQIGGHGGSGAHIEGDSWIFASDSGFFGERGGNADFMFTTYAGDGGHGVNVEAGSSFVHLDCSFGHGMNGWAVGPNNGVPGLPIAGAGDVQALAGSARLAFGGPLAAQGSTLQLALQGEAGDILFLGASPRAGFHPWLPSNGVWLLPFPPQVRAEPLGVLAGQNAFLLAAAAPALPEGRHVLHLQALHHGSLGSFLGPGRSVAVVPPDPVDALDDCNGNGISDLHEILSGALTDLHGDLVPDACGPP